MNSNGDITALGKQYIGEQAPQTAGSGSPDGPYAPGGISAAASLYSTRADCSFLLLVVGLLAGSLAINVIEVVA